MEVIPNIKSSPRLLETAAVEVRNTPTTEAEASHHKLKRSGSFGNIKAVFYGVLCGALLIAGGGYLAQPRDAADHQFASVRRFFAVRTRAVSGVTTGDKSSPLSVQIDPSMIRVTAIALGHPRLAIINGKEVTEGDLLTLTTPDGGISVSLRIVNIVEGRIELTDGTHVLTAPLATRR